MRKWLPTFLWMGLIFLGSSLSSTQVTSNTLLQNIINNLGHFSEYFILTFLVRRSLAPFPRLSLNFFIPTLYAASDEWHQHFVPGRTMDIKDFFVDTLAVITFLYLQYRRDCFTFATHSKTI